MDEDDPSLIENLRADSLRPHLCRQKRVDTDFPDAEQENRNLMPANRPESPGAKGEIEGMKIKWDDSNMKSSYANVCNVTSTREEVVMLFGMNQAWNRGQKEVTIQLTDRIVISPYAAKRLAMLLGGVVTQYESRFGVLNVDMPPASGASGTAAPAPDKKN